MKKTLLLETRCRMMKRTMCIVLIAAMLLGIVAMAVSFMIV